MFKGVVSPARQCLRQVSWSSMLQVQNLQAAVHEWASFQNLDASLTCLRLSPCPAAEGMSFLDGQVNGATCNIECSLGTHPPGLRMVPQTCGAPKQQQQQQPSHSWVGLALLWQNVSRHLPRLPKVEHLFNTSRSPAQGRTPLHLYRYNTLNTV
jgi:hypothetical protein